MGKIIISLVIFITLINNVQAEVLELSDVIKQAREANNASLYANNQNRENTNKFQNKKSPQCAAKDNINSINNIKAENSSSELTQTSSLSR